MSIQQIYSQYKIMPILAMHQLRVAAVASLLLDHLSEAPDKELIITACLLHDMGNILKFDLNRFPEFNQPEGIDYWQQVKEEVAKRYGTTDEHLATLKIVGELGVSSDVSRIIDHIGFKEAINNLSQPLDVQIASYADMRVGPMGVVSLHGRLEDGRRRYAGHINELSNDQELYAALDKLEDRLFKNLDIKPEEITDAAIAAKVEELRNYKI